MTTASPCEWPCVADTCPCACPVLPSSSPTCSAHMATRPAKGKLFLPPPPLWRHGDVRLSNAAGRMCTMPVARMTPAANALTAKKMSPSGRSAAMERPSTGTSTPAAPAVRMDAMATSFSFSAPCLSAPSVAVVQSQPLLAAACCANKRSHGSTCKVGSDTTKIPRPCGHVSLTSVHSVVDA